MAEAAGVALAVPSIIVLCIKYGKELKGMVHAYQHMKQLFNINEFVVELVDGETKQLLGYFSTMHGVTGKSIR
jgi:hypothetical protein